MTPTTPSKVFFKDFPLIPEIARSLETLGFESPTEIQEKAFPILLHANKTDFHGQAQTGTGKTLAFGIPLIQKIDTSVRKVQGLIVAPTRELVLQICQSLRQVAQFTNIDIQPIYGGASMYEQIQALRKGPHIIVGTPGRLNDHLRRRTLVLDTLQTLVLDEADIMLDMGFKEEVDEILSYAPTHRQIWLFSATVKPGISAIMQSHMKNPASVRVAKSTNSTNAIKQYYCIVPSRDRVTALYRFFDSIPTFYGFIFCQTKILTSEVAEQLARRGYKVNALHGDMSQQQRNRVIKQFKNKECTIVVATDVAARGIDIADLTHVVNYSLPDDQESYVHRIGRTGRAGKEGTAITFINPSDVRRIGMLQRKFNITIQQLAIPSLASIMQARIAQAAENLTVACHHAPTSEYALQLKQLVAEYSQEDLVNAVVTYLDEKYLKHLTQDKDIAQPKGHAIETEGYESESTVQEFSFNVGSEHNITREDIINHVLKHTQGTLTENLITKVKVIKRRSFIMVPKDIAHAVFSLLQKRDINGQRVRIDLVDSSQEENQGRNFGSRRREQSSSSRHSQGGRRPWRSN